FVSPVFRGRFGPLLVRPEIFVRFEDGISPRRAEALATIAGEIVETDAAGVPGVYRVRSALATGLAVLDAANTLAALPEVRFAEPDMVVTGRVQGDPVIPDDTLFDRLWGLHNTAQLTCISTGTDDIDMDAPEAWAITTGDPSIITVIIDSGYQLDHPDLNHSGLAMDFTDSGGDGGPNGPQECHGTTTAGCVSAIINNAFGVVGSAPGCELASAFSSQVGWYASSITWAQTIGARVTNSSLALGAGPFALIETAFQTTRAAGVVHFSGTGNDGAGAISYPGSSPFVNAVGAIDFDGAIASFSNQGAGIAFVAPGVEVITTDRTGDDGQTSGSTVCLAGTSQSSPYAAGVAALVLSRDPSLTAEQVESVMQMSAMDLGAIGYDTTFGWGLVNAHQALLLACEMSPACACPADVDGDGDVDVDDLVALILAWGTCPGCSEDVNDDDQVNVDDLVILILAWGPCR
ncbi:MAG: S8 family peptidase, partial [Planctomycetota bacterium]